MEEEKQLNFDAPFLSVRRVPTQPDNTKNKKKVYQATLVRLLQQDRSFDHVMEPSSVPFQWEQTPGKPKDFLKLVEESDLIKALDMVSSTASFSVNCSTSGVSDEFEKNEERSRSSVSKDDVISEYRDLIMSRFLPDAKAMAMMKQKKETSLNQEKKMKKQRIALERVSKAIDQDLNSNYDDDNDDDGYDHNHHHHHNRNLHSPRKAMYGFLPQFCSKNSLDIINPILSRVKTCQDLGVKSEKVVKPRSLHIVHKTQLSTSLPRILSKGQEHYPTKPRISKAISKNSPMESREIIRRNPSRLQRTTTSDQIQRQGTRFLVEEVKRNKIRSRNLCEASLVSQPPLPKTPSESWLCRTIPRSSAVATVVSGQSARFKKIEQRSINWETMVKTSHNHHDHARYSEELVVVHPSRQRKY